jgi:hypothetical protein
LRIPDCENVGVGEEKVSAELRAQAMLLRYLRDGSRCLFQYRRSLVQAVHAAKRMIIVCRDYRRGIGVSLGYQGTPKKRADHVFPICQAF